MAHFPFHSTGKKIMSQFIDVWKKSAEQHSFSHSFAEQVCMECYPTKQTSVMEQLGAIFPRFALATSLGGIALVTVFVLLQNEVPVSDPIESLYAETSPLIWEE